jgi:hypothetical protein
MSEEYKSHFYVPADDEVAQLIVARAAEQCGARICPLVAQCHRECMVLMGRCYDDALDERGENISLVVNLWCDNGSEYDLDENRREVIQRGACETTPELIVPKSWVKPAGTTKERGRRLYVHGMMSAVEDEDDFDEGVTYYP